MVYCVHDLVNHHFLGSQKSVKIPFVSVMMILIFFLNGFVKAYQ